MRTLSVIIGLLIVLLIAFKISTFTTTEYTQALKIQFGKPVGEPITKAGLHFRKPFIQNIKYFDKRIELLSESPNSEQVDN